MAFAKEVSSFGGGEYSDRSLPAPVRDVTGGELVLKFIVYELAAGEDPTAASDVPAFGSSIAIGTVSYLVDRIECIQRFPEGAAWIVVWCSTDRRFRFPDPHYNPEIDEREISSNFRQEVREAPTFVSREVEIIQPSGPIGTLEWKQQPIRYTVNIIVLNVTLHLAANRSVEEYLDLLDQAAEQIDHLHRFRDRLWRFVSCTLIRTSQGKLELAYTWEHDPGNGPIGINIGDGSAPGHALRAPARGPFEEYQVIGAGVGLPAPPPTVFTIPIFDNQGNAFYDLDGWQALPQNPLG